MQSSLCCCVYVQGEGFELVQGQVVIEIGVGLCLVLFVGLGCVIVDEGVVCLDVCNIYGQVCVICLQGSVCIEYLQGCLQLQVGQQIWFDECFSGVVVEVVVLEVSVWIEGMLVFCCVLLYEVVDEINCYWWGRVLLG